MSKENIGLKIFSDPLVFSKFFAIIRCDRMNFNRQRLQKLDDSISYSFSRFLRSTFFKRARRDFRSVKVLRRMI
jgi:hypothetical protein